MYRFEQIFPSQNNSINFLQNEQQFQEPMQMEQYSNQNNPNDSFQFDQAQFNTTAADTLDPQPAVKIQKIANKKYKQIKYKDMILTQIQQPINLQNSDYYMKKKFQVKLFYFNKNFPQKTRQFTVRFGNKSQEDYYENFNEKIKLRRRLQNYDFKDNPFHPGFWQYHLLNDQKDILSSYNQIIQTYQTFV